MAYTEYDFKYLENKYTLPGAREKFESSCSQLLQKMYSKESVHRIEVAQGDGGIDIMIIDNKAKEDAIKNNSADKDKIFLKVYQCKYFADKMNSSRWNQVKHSFERARTSNEFKLTEWVLCVSRTFTLNEMTYWDQWKTDMFDNYKIPIDLMDGDNLLAKMKDVKIYNEIFNVEEAIKLDRLYEQNYGPYDVIEEYRQKNVDKFPDSFIELSNLQKKYFDGNASDINLDFDEYKKKVDADLRKKEINDTQKKEFQSHWRYWAGMIKKNILYNAKDPSTKIYLNEAIKYFKDSKLGISYLELYKYYKTQKDETKAKDYLEKACKENVAEACLEDSKRKLKDAENNKIDYDEAVVGLYKIAGKHLQKEKLITKKFLNEVCGIPANTKKLSNYLCSGQFFVADALYLIQKYNDKFSSKYRLSDSKKEEVFQESLYLGCNDAYDDSTKSGNPLTPDTSCASSDSSGICYINATNEREEWFRKSMPVSWECKSISTENDNILDTVKDKYPIRFLFIDNNLQKNMHEAMELLETFRQNSPSVVGKDIEVFIRCKVSQAAPIIDTFQNCMKGDKIPVHLIDEDRLGVQQLLSKHPLFYPAFKARINGTKTSYYDGILNSQVKETPIHLTIVGNNNCALWLLREASWMMCLPQDNTKVRMSGSITVLGEQAWKLEEQFKSLCPGLYGDYRDKSILKKGQDATKNLEDWLPLPSYNFHNISSNMEAFSTLLSSEFYPTNYIVVCEGTDMENMETAIRIRQLMVRKYRNNPAAMPIIAYYCQDSYLAYIGKRTVIDNERLGHKWTNNYQIIPFGPWQIYTWKNLMCDVTEEMSRCVHLAYCKVKTDESIDKINENLRDYYDREYNRDSSRAIVLSLPYRLYVTALTKGEDEERKKDLLEKFFHRWRFEDDDYFYSDEASDQIANLLKEEMVTIKDSGNKKKIQLFTEEEIEKMKVWEHNRWACWMLSRGHLPMSAERMVNFIRMGNFRQNLSIGKLHALICPFDDIENVENKLLIVRNDNRKPGYLRDLDIELVQKTADFWNRSWFKGRN